MDLLRRFFVCVVLIASYLPCHAAGSPWLQNADSLNPRFVWAVPAGTDLAKGPESLLSLHLLRDRDTAALGVAAAYSESEGQIRMELLTSLDYDGRYILRWQGAEGRRAAEYRVPARPHTETAVLTDWYPHTDTVPANLLFFQLRFSKPMQPDVNAWKYLSIREDRANGEAIQFAWRQRSYWFDSGRVLQVMVHPGRVKSGIDYGGPLLFAERKYVVEIGEGLVDMDGNRLPAQGSKRLIATAADHTIPSLRSVSTHIAAGSTGAISIRFSEAMDYSGLLSGLHIYDAQHNRLAFSIESADDGRIVRVIPKKKWKAGTYSLELDSEVRDLGANTLRRPFEVHDVREAAMDSIPFRYRFRAR